MVSLLYFVINFYAVYKNSGKPYRLLRARKKIPRDFYRGKRDKHVSLSRLSPLPRLSRFIIQRFLVALEMTAELFTPLKPNRHYIHLRRIRTA